MNVNATIFLRRLLYGVILGVVIYAGFALFSDADALSDTLDAFPLIVILGACGLSLVNYALRFLKWHAYLHLLELRVPLGHSLLVFMAGLIMAISPGKVGEVVKSGLLKRSQNIPIARTAPIILAERLTDLLGLCIIASFGIIAFEYGLLFFAFVLAAILVGIAMLQSSLVVGKILDLLEKMPLVRRFRPDLDRAYISTKTLLHLRPLVAATLLSALAWSMEALAMAWILTTLGVTPPLLFEAFFVFSTSTLIGALSFLPGGLGITEGSMTGLLLWLELFDDFDLALAATYLIRFTTLWFGVIVGFLAFLLYERRQRRRDSGSTSSEISAADNE